MRTTEGFVVEKLERIYTAMAKVIKPYYEFLTEYYASVRVSQ